MYLVFAVFLLISGQFLLATNGVLGSQYFGSGKRIVGDQLLLKDVQHSRPAGINEAANVIFNYNIAEPITYIEIVSEENISAEVKFSYTDNLVVGIVRLVNENESSFNNDSNGEFMAAGEIMPSMFDVIIRIFGFNDTKPTLDPALLLNRDAEYEGLMKPQYDTEKEDDELDEDYEEKPIDDADFESEDKIIEIGKRQEGDDLVYEMYQTSPEMPQGRGDYTLIFHYIDSDYITYVKFVIIDHFVGKASTAMNYKAPVAEYSHYSPSTFKATITDFNITSMFVQMFVYGYRGLEKAPPDYKPFLPPPHWYRNAYQEVTTPSLMDIQLTLLRNDLSTESAPYNDTSDEDEDSGIRPEDMIPDHVPEARSVENAALVHQATMGQPLYALLILLLFTVA